MDIVGVVEGTEATVYVYNVNYVFTVVTPAQAFTASVAEGDACV